MKHGGILKGPVWGNAVQGLLWAQSGLYRARLFLAADGVVQGSMKAPWNTSPVDKESDPSHGAQRVAWKKEKAQKHEGPAKRRYP